MVKAIRAALHQARDTFLIGGPVGLWIVLRQAWLARQLRRTTERMDIERDVHRWHLASLRARQNELIGQQQALNITAIQFWHYCDRKAGEGKGGAS